MAKNKNNVIILFGNQKGGVGKSTLCALFANFLLKKKKDVCIIDTDNQKTLYGLRNEETPIVGQAIKEQIDKDIKKIEAKIAKLDTKRNAAKIKDLNIQKQILEKKKNEDYEPPYDVAGLNIDDSKATAQVLKSIESEPGFFLIDAPGNPKEQGLFPIFDAADYIIVPFQYDRGTFRSTEEYAKAIRLIGESGQAKVHAKFIFVPNRIDSRMGTATDEDDMDDKDDILANYGVVTPEINYKKCVIGYNTLELTPDQNEAVRYPFNAVLKEIRKSKK